MKGLCPLLVLSLALASPAFGQQSCSVQSQAQLLPQFSDSAPPGSITPGNIRNIICSALLLQAPGGAQSALAPSTSPFTYTVTSTGTLTISSGQVQFSRDNGSTFLTLGLTGGVIPVRQNDIIRVTWFTSVIPTIFFLPAS